MAAKKTAAEPTLAKAAAPAQDMYCRACHYSLNGIKGRRCPECGAAFDPNDANTYYTAQELGEFGWRWEALASGACVLPVVAALLLRASDASGPNAKLGLLAGMVFAMCAGVALGVLGIRRGGEPSRMFAGTFLALHAVLILVFLIMAFKLG